MVTWVHMGTHIDTHAHTSVFRGHTLGAHTHTTQRGQTDTHIHTHMRHGGTHKYTLRGHTHFLGYRGVN